MAQFVCQSCGGALYYDAKTQNLSCQTCQQQEKIAVIHETIPERDFVEALNNSRHPLQPLQSPKQQITCQQCGGLNDWDYSVQADVCGYCKSPIVEDDEKFKALNVDGILPFVISDNEAEKAFHQWVKSRWFAPNDLKSMGGHEKRFKGVYLPHWTFDTVTNTHYRGQRGTIHIRYETVWQIENGKRVRKTVPKQEIRWQNVSGQVNLAFDDILVLASAFLPKVIVNKLSPWQLNKAVPYDEAFLSGMRADYYQIDLENAYQIAKSKIQSHIYTAICRDIGGDRQQISSQSTQYYDNTFKLLLLPVWYSALEYKGKPYQMIVNGQTGQITGEYPKSIAKIITAIIVALIISTIVLYFGKDYL